MRALVNSAIGFGKGASGAIAATIAAVTDPLKWPQAFGFMSDWHWTIEPWQRQAIFAAVAFVWMFVWYHRQRTKYEDSRPAKPDMPLHEAARYIARKSSWAAARKSQEDGSWVSDVSQELMSGLHCGHVQSWGDVGPSLITTPIPKEQFSRPKWNSHYLSMGRVAPSMLTGTDGTTYSTVRLNRAQVIANWPRRSWREAGAHYSPIDRLNLGNRGYDDMFAAQDNMYQRTHGLEVEILQ